MSNKIGPYWGGIIPRPEEERRALFHTISPNLQRRPVLSAGIASQGWKLVLGQARGIRVLDLETGDPVQLDRDLEDEAQLLAVSADSDWVAVRYGEGGIVLHQLGQSRPRRINSTGTRVVALSDDGSRVATGALDGRVRVHEVQSGALLRTLGEGGGQGNRGICSLAFSQYGDRLAVGCVDGSAQVYDVDRRTRLLSLDDQPGWVAPVCLSRTGDRLCTVSVGTAQARVYEVGSRSSEPLLSLDGPPGGVTSVAFSRAGDRLYTAGSEAHQVWVYEMGSEAPVVLGGHRERIGSVAAHGRDDQLLTASDDGTVVFWSVRDGQAQVLFFNVPDETLWSAARNPQEEGSFFDGLFFYCPNRSPCLESVVVMSADRKVLLPDDLQRRSYLLGYNEWKKVLDFVSPDGQRTLVPPPPLPKPPPPLPAFKPPGVLPAPGEDEAGEKR